ncbi:MAG TPA: VWA domain-containing protein [Ornithinimicrobium sp.]|uniref:vWA domain-containing protein n=1 Tax=Ornithinimicrobium sp. TaxID=1977084 RepID=UPI002B49462F|nr:VWA domain-containing protein [Ornithinimicrobium sp.]HKJ12342.1 VWA domain-containing protein [Ornithinimicrobium sp.]
MTWTAEELLLGFTRALRSAGVMVSADRSLLFLRAVARVGVDDRDRVYWAGRATLTASPADLAVFDQVFAQWFGGAEMHSLTYPSTPTPTAMQAAWDDAPDGDGQPQTDHDHMVRAVSSNREVLRHRDIARLTAAERASLRREFARLRPHPPIRRARRYARAHRGEIDGPATLRGQLRRMGEPAVVARRQHGMRTRRVVLLVDTSGSMSAYADALLRLAHTVVQSAPRNTEVFAMGTRLTHLTRALRLRDADQALVTAGHTVSDWSGGTRLGEVLGAFLDRWGRRGMARGAVVVVFSDGWERSHPEVLGEQARRLASMAHRVVWVNPHRGRPGYSPVQGGIVAALPHVDDFVAGHSLTAFEEVLEVVARA